MPVRTRRILTLVFIAVVGIWSVYAVGQPGGQKGGKGPGKGKGGAPDPTASLPNIQFLLSERVREELQITEDQSSQVRSLYERFRRRMLGTTSPRSGSRDETERLREEFDTELGEILQAEQVQRFKQIQLQQELQKDTLTALTGDTEIAKTLDVTDDQKKQLRAAAREGEEYIREGIERLREEARQKIVDALSPEQKEKLLELTGDKFEMSPPPNLKRGGAQRGPGAQGPAKGKGGPGKGPGGRPQ